MRVLLVINGQKPVFDPLIPPEKRNVFFATINVELVGTNEELIVIV